MTKFEYCVECNEPTYNAGEGDGSLYLDDKGPYCDACYYGNLYEGYHRLKAENQRLREALEWIQDHKEDRDDRWVEQVKYLTFKPVPGGFRILFNGTDHGGTIVQEVDGEYYFLPKPYGGVYPDYLLREILEKLEELNKEDE